MVKKELNRSNPVGYTQNTAEWTKVDSLHPTSSFHSTDRDGLSDEVNWRMTKEDTGIELDRNRARTE